MRKILLVSSLLIFGLLKSAFFHCFEFKEVKTVIIPKDDFLACNYNVVNMMKCNTMSIENYDVILQTKYFNAL